MPGKFIEGRYLDLPPAGFNNNPALLTPPNDLPDFAPVASTSYMIMESEGFIERQSQVSAGQHNKAWRNFRWLPWIPGKVSYLPLPGDAVLTGPFTGCWVAIFDLGGASYVGHIGTDQNSGHPNSVQVKKAWKQAVDRRLISPRSAFNPLDGIPLQFDGAPTFYALISANGEMHSVVLTKPNKGGNPLKQKIALVRQAQPRPQPLFA